MIPTSDPKEDYRRWVFEGNCPCCFPFWDYGVKMNDVWAWEDEFQSWEVYAEIMKEYDEDD